MSIITRKIELKIFDTDPENKKKSFEKLLDISNKTHRIANDIVTNQFFNEIAENRIISADGTIRNISDDIRKAYRKSDTEKTKELEKLKEEQLKLRSESKEKYYYNTSKENSTFRFVSNKYSDIPTDILSSINRTICKYIKNEKNKVFNGEQTLRTYKKGFPIFFSTMEKIVKENDNYLLKWVHKIVFSLSFGRDRSNNKAIVDGILNNQYKYCGSSITVNKARIFLNLVVDIPKKEHKLDYNKNIGIDLGIVKPIYCVASDNPELEYLCPFEGKELFNRRMEFRKRKRELQKSLTIVSGGRGRKDKLKALERLNICERNFVKTFNHNLSKEIVKFALKNDIGVIKMEDLSGFGKNSESKKIILSAWSYYELQTMVQYKAEREGIKVVFVDPKETSQTCSHCGNVDKNQRISREKFICNNADCDYYGKEVDADHNAAINISKSIKIKK